MTLGSHQTSIGRSQSWCSPRWMVTTTGPYDLDPCAADPRPWDCAAINITSGGLEFDWGRHRVWLNPPYDRREVGRWIEKLARHGRGTALLHPRTETDWFALVWRYATSILFLANRIYFHHPDGTRPAANSRAPPVLCAFGAEDHERLKASRIPGFLVTDWDGRSASEVLELRRVGHGHR